MLVTSIVHDETFTIREPELATQLATVARQVEGSKTQNTLNFFTPPARLEVEDAFFHHDRSRVTDFLTSNGPSFLVWADWGVPVSRPIEAIAGSVTS
jgi:hypothetical protein